MGNMDSIVFLGGREASTLKDISENCLGKATISMQTEGRKMCIRDRGYRFYERHKRFISVNLLENIAVVIVICIVSIFISNASVGIALLIGALLTIIAVSYTHLFLSGK